MIYYFFFRLFVFVLSLIPYERIFIISDILCFFVAKVFKYRSKIIDKNISIVFQNLSKENLDKIKKQFYRNLCDIFIETLKVYTLKPEKIKEIFELDFYENYKKYYERGLNVIYVGAHCGNWEVATNAIPLLIEYKVNILYKPLTNKYIDKYVLNRRQKNKAFLYSIFDAAKAFQNNEKYCVVMLSDQRPLPYNKGYEVEFFGKKTYFLTGAEILAKKNNCAVVFFWISRKERGKYKIITEEITLSPKDTGKGQITEQFVKLLEKYIKTEPDNWLWSHNRWKFL